MVCAEEILRSFHYYSMEEEIDEATVPSLLHELSEASLEAIDSKNYAGALELLRKTSDIIEAFVSNGGTIEDFQMLVTINNSACCLQRLNKYEEALGFLDACLYHSKYLKTNSFLADLRLLKYECFILLQTCAVKSKLDQHVEALKLAQTSLQKSLSMMKRFKGVTKKIIQKSLQAKSQGKLTERLSSLYSSAKKVKPIFADLEQMLSRNELKEPEQIRSIMGLTSPSEWALTLCLSDIMTVSPIALDDLKRPTNLKVEFTRDAMLLKIVFIAVSHFCIGVEIRYLNLSAEPEFDTDASWYISQSIKLLKAYFPESCPMLKHIINAQSARLFTRLPEIPEESSKKKKVFNRIQKLPSVSSRIHKAKPKISITPDISMMKESTRKRTKSEAVMNKYSTSKSFEIGSDRRGLRVE
mmetsp:Transcript_7608/g.14299  ORF Transcript_7608/g.14299 Transcript_7608/m.14299 type:complete len:413 (-) Transcript_7608:4965-6203(-)